ncbi:MAG: DUF5522 domain-containing protein [Pyrinomonadaceae bacterium]|nr:DUF5522 domain-containing protein [Pyrinomonadaceae bacterium]
MFKTREPNGKQEPTQDTDASDTQQIVLQEGLDYYLENGLMVFTAVFLGKRGYCCERGCRHCPYGYLDNQKQQG